MGSQLFIKSVTINMSANVEKSAKPKNRESKKRLWLLALVWEDDSRLRKQRASRSQRRLPRRQPLQRKRPRNLLLKRLHLKRLKKQSRQQRQRQPSLRNPWQRNRRKSQLLKRRRPRKSSD